MSGRLRIGTDGVPVKKRFSITWLVLVVDLGDDGAIRLQVLSAVWQGKQARLMWLEDKLAELVVGDTRFCCDWSVCPSDKDKNHSSSFIDFIWWVINKSYIVNFTQWSVNGIQAFYDCIISDAFFWWSLANSICDWLIKIGHICTVLKIPFLLLSGTFP